MNRQTFTIEIKPDTDLTEKIARLAALYARDLCDCIGEELLQAAAEPDMTEDDLSDRLNELCDAGNNQLIYTWHSRCYLMGTNNEDAYADEIGEPAPSVEAAATMALIADVRAAHWDRAVEIMEQAEAEAAERAEQAAA